MIDESNRVGHFPAQSDVSNKKTLFGGTKGQKEPGIKKLHSSALFSGGDLWAFVLCRLG